MEIFTKMDDKPTFSIGQIKNLLNTINLSSIQYILQYFNNEKNSITVDSIRHWFLLKTYVNIRMDQIFSWGWNALEECPGAYMNDLDNVDFWQDAMTNLGKNIFKKLSNTHMDLARDDQDDVSPANYFRLFDGFFDLSYSLYGYEGNASCFNELEIPLNKIECVRGDKGYYHSEFIICIILDICFSAINNSRNWDEELSDPVAERLMLRQYEFLAQHKKSNNKTLLKICTENGKSGIDYLVFKNRKVLKSGETIEKLKRELDNLVRNNLSKRLSLWTAKRYIENVWESDKKATVIYEYEHEKSSDEWYFVTKLPIIKGM